MGLILLLPFSRIGKRGFLRHVALNTDQRALSVSMEPLTLMGMTGVASTDLRPSGKVYMEESFTANSLKGFVDKGDEVVVIR